MVIAGLLALYAGAEGMVKGSSALALRLGITPFIVGLTVISFGTSAPELLVSILGTDGIAVGNVLGSNVANLALILGVTALIQPVDVQPRTLRRDIPIMVGATVLFLAVAIDGTLTRIDGLILLGGMALYFGYTFFEARRDMDRSEAAIARDLEESEFTLYRWPVAVVMTVAGIAALALGAKWMVDGSIVIAEYLGVSDLVIGISIVAFGTSLPELATSAVAAFRDEADISVGNVIGSNIFNLLLVLGVVGVIGDVIVDADALRIDIWIVLIVSIALWPLLRIGDGLQRRDGFILLAVYIGYMISLFLR